MTVTAVIDLNSISDDGTTRVREPNLSGAVAVGDDVIIRELEDDITGHGVIARLADGYVRITVDRDSLRTGAAQGAHDPSSDSATQ